jgi:glycosyltransferase involved in cell wall biosynthesis
LNREKIKILYLITSTDMGGAQTALVQIASHLDSRFELRVATPKSEGGLIERQLDEAGSPVIDLAITKWFPFTGLFRFTRLVRGWKPDVVVTALFHATTLGVAAGILNRNSLVVVWEVNQNLGGRFRSRFRKLLSRGMDLIITDAAGVKDTVETALGHAGPTVELVRTGGVDLSVFKPAESPPGNKQQLHMMTVGRLHRQKGLDVLIRACAQLPSDLDYKVSIAGEGSERKLLEKMILDLGLQNRIFLIGLEEDIPTFLQSGDIYLQPSRWEGLCLTVTEAMACGLPVVASKVGGIPESVIHDETGLLVESEDVESLVESILHLANDPSKRSTMGNASRVRAEQLFDGSKMVQRFSDTLESTVLKNRNLKFDELSQLWVDQPQNS